MHCSCTCEKSIRDSKKVFFFNIFVNILQNEFTLAMHFQSCLNFENRQKRKNHNYDENLLQDLLLQSKDVQRRNLQEYSSCAVINSTSTIEEIAHIVLEEAYTKMCKRISCLEIIFQELSQFQTLTCTSAAVCFISLMLIIPRINMKAQLFDSGLAGTIAEIATNGYRNSKLFPSISTSFKNLTQLFITRGKYVRHHHHNKLATLHETITHSKFA